MSIYSIIKKETANGLFKNYLFFFLCLFFLRRFFRLWLRILPFLRFLPQGINLPPYSTFFFKLSLTRSFSDSEALK